MKRFETPKDGRGMYSPPEPDDAFDVVAELDRAHLILQRELRNLARASAAGKLSAPEARDLVAYVKLLSDLKRDSEANLAGLTDEELLQLKK